MRKGEVVKKIKYFEARGTEWKTLQEKGLSKINKKKKKGGKKKIPTQKKVPTPFFFFSMSPSPFFFFGDGQQRKRERKVVGETVFGDLISLVGGFQVVDGCVLF